MRIIHDATPKHELAAIAREQFGSLVKAVVDVERGVMAVGGELHADAEALLLADGSRQEDLWGVNLYPEKSMAEWIEFDSIINLRPAQGNPSRSVEDPQVRDTIAQVIQKLIV